MTACWTAHSDVELGSVMSRRKTPDKDLIVCLFSFPSGGTALAADASGQNEPCANRHIAPRCTEAER